MLFALVMFSDVVTEKREKYGIIYKEGETYETNDMFDLLICI